MYRRTAIIHFLDPRRDPPQDLDTDPRTVLALPHTSNRVVTVSAATVATDPHAFFCWAEIPQVRLNRPLRRAA